MFNLVAAEASGAEDGEEELEFEPGFALDTDFGTLRHEVSSRKFSPPFIFNPDIFNQDFSKNLT